MKNWKITLDTMLLALEIKFTVVCFRTNKML